MLDQTTAQRGCAREILDLPVEDVARWIRQKRDVGQLSQVVAQLNAELGSDSPEGQHLAQQALDALGFVPS